MEVVQRPEEKWACIIKPGKERVFNSYEEACAFAGIATHPLPLPEVREYNSLEEALKGEDDHDEDHIAEED